MSLGGGSPKIITLNSEYWVHSAPNHFLLNIDCWHSIDMKNTLGWSTSSHLACVYSNDLLVDRPRAGQNRHADRCHSDSWISPRCSISTCLFGSWPVPFWLAFECLIKDPLHQRLWRLNAADGNLMMRLYRTESGESEWIQCCVPSWNQQIKMNKFGLCYDSLMCLSLWFVNGTNSTVRQRWSFKRQNVIHDCAHKNW